jgi:hypothetical protein
MAGGWEDFPRNREFCTIFKESAELPPPPRSNFGRMFQMVSGESRALGRKEQLLVRMELRLGEASHHAIRKGAGRTAGPGGWPL